MQYCPKEKERLGVKKIRRGENRPVRRFIKLPCSVIALSITYNISCLTLWSTEVNKDQHRNHDVAHDRAIKLHYVSS